MTIANTPETTANPRTVTITCPARRRGNRQQVGARKLGPTTVLLAVAGEVDAATAPDLFDVIESGLRGYHQLVLDLSRVGFFGAAGFSLLHRLHVHCLRASIDWVVLTGPAVQRLLKICDPDGTVPAAANIVSAVAALARGPHRTPQLGVLR